MKASTNQKRTLERFRYWQGQMLRSSDFRGQMQTEAQLRWWHNRSLHNAFGVALGFDVAPTTGLVLAAQVEPGVAYDCFGRALILLTQETVPVPAVASTATTSMTLVVHYRETAEYRKPRDTTGVCLTCCGDSEAREKPDFTWLPSESYTPRCGVALARVVYTKGVPRLDEQFIVLSTRPEARPYLANGSTIPGSTPWSSWQESGVELGLQTLVDTSTAGFTRIPCYFAWLEGLDPALAQASATPVIFTHIDTLSPVSFMFRVLVYIPQQAEVLLAARASALRRKRFPFYVCWLGCQSGGDTDQCLGSAVEKPCCS